MKVNIEALIKFVFYSAVLFFVVCALFFGFIVLNDDTDPRLRDSQLVADCYSSVVKDCYITQFVEGTYTYDIFRNSSGKKINSLNKINKTYNDSAVRISRYIAELYATQNTDEVCVEMKRTKLLAHDDVYDEVAGGLSFLEEEFEIPMEYFSARLCNEIELYALDPSEIPDDAPPPPENSDDVVIDSWYSFQLGQRLY